MRHKLKHKLKEVVTFVYIKPKIVLNFLIFFIVCRSGSSILCFQHLCHLLKVVKHLAHHHGRPEKTYLMVLTGRLLSLLPNKHKVQIVEMFPPHTEPLVWQALSVKVLPEKLRESVTENLIRSAILHAENFLTLPASVELYFHMVCMCSLFLCLGYIEKSYEWWD